MSSQRHSLIPQRPHASSVSKRKRKPKTDSKERGRKQTYSIGDSNWVDLLCYLSRVQRWTPLKKLVEDRREVLERSQRKGRSGGVFRKMVAQMGMRLRLLTFPMNTYFPSNNIIIICSFHFYHFYSYKRFYRLLQKS